MVYFYERMTEQILKKHRDESHLPKIEKYVHDPSSVSDQLLAELVQEEKKEKKKEKKRKKQKK